MAVTPWVAVSPASNPDAILGGLPLAVGTATYDLPTSVVPADATGILVFVWCAISGTNSGGGYWHTAVNVGDGTQNWFSLLAVGTPQGASAVAFNSQAFWLPMPIDSKVSVTLAGSGFSGGSKGQVEIHGYMPAPDPQG
jgi:hypothetical protein